MIKATKHLFNALSNVTESLEIYSSVLPTHATQVANHAQAAMELSRLQASDRLQQARAAYAAKQEQQTNVIDV